MDLAYVEVKLRKFDEAERLYNEQLQINPEDANARHNLAAVRNLMQTRDPSAAQTSYAPR